MRETAPAELLLVEDDPQNVELILRALERHHLPHKVAVLRDGAAALEFIFGLNADTHRGDPERPRVIFLDLKLPKVDGLEVLRRLKSDRRRKRIPVVVLTSSQEDCDIVACYELGANSYVVKPADAERFARWIAALASYWLECNTAPPLNGGD